MSDLSFWDILYLKDEISTEMYTFITWGIPLIILAIILVGGAIYVYGPDVKYRLKRIYRRKKK